MKWKNVVVVTVASLFVLAASATSRVAAADNPYPGLPIENAPQLFDLRAKLDEPTEFEFVEAPLTDVVAHLKDQHEIEIQIDASALEEAGVDQGIPLTRALKNVSLRSALRLMLSHHGLTYVIRDEVVLVTSQVAAAQKIETRVYPVHDLLWEPNADHEAIPPQFDELVDVVTASIQPDCWADAGGNSSIRASRTTHSLIISAPMEVHEKIDALLGTLREARNLQFGE